MKNAATTVKDYLAALPDDRRKALAAVRKVILDNLDGGYEEGIQYGNIGYFVPHSIFPAGYHCDPKQPLPFVGLASQKSSMALYLMCIYGQEASEDWFRKAWAKSGKKLDMGKACVRFKSLDDVALDVVGQLIRRMPVKAYLRSYEESMAARPARRAGPARPARAARGRTARAAQAVRSARTGSAPRKR